MIHRLNNHRKALIAFFNSRTQKIYVYSRLFLLLGFALPSHALVSDNQSSLDMTINEVSHRTLNFDWPAIKIGTASYEDGPTGVTVIEFTKRSLVAMDVRGGSSGTINAPFVDNLYNMPMLDAIVLSGGSWYGLETATAVATAMKDDGVRSGSFFSGEQNIAQVLGSIIYDYGDRRLNEIYPDKRLAQAAYRNTQTGTFPMGAYGGGRNAQSGAYFECKAASGQGAAYRKIGTLKIAAFTVVNPFGVVVDRNGYVAACHTSNKHKTPLKISDLWKQFPHNRSKDWSGFKRGSKNTTISVVVINQTLEPALLKRLAVQIHSSMARSIQPFSTASDGDVMYVVSTGEINEKLDWIDIGSAASELMWDAVLASVPQQTQSVTANPDLKISKQLLDKLTGTYHFSRFVQMKIKRKNKHLYASVTKNSRSAFGINKDKPTQLIPVSDELFTVPGRCPLTFKFDRSNHSLTLNPGRWQQIGNKTNTR